MYSKKDDNENKGRRSGKGPKLSKGMKKAARKEKKVLKKQGKQLKKGVKKIAKEIGKVSRFQGSTPKIGNNKLMEQVVKSIRPTLVESGPTPSPVRKYNLVEKIKPTGPAPKPVSGKVDKKKELTRGQKRSHELRHAHM